jgi:DNA-binding Lrp family transcriptional regulator
MKTHDLDVFDLKILDRLQIDNRTSLSEIGKAVNLSAAAVQRRVRRMEDAKIIQANVAVVDPRAVGRPITLIVEVQLDSERADILDNVRCQSKRRLIEHCQFRLGHERAADCEHLLFAAGHGTGDLTTAFGQAGKLREDTVLVRAHTIRISTQISAHVEIFLDRHIRKYTSAFRTVRDATCQYLPGRTRRNVSSFKHDAARSRRKNSRNAAERRAFAGTIGTDERDELSLLDG